MLKSGLVSFICWQNSLLDKPTLGKLSWAKHPLDEKSEDEST